MQSRQHQTSDEEPACSTRNTLCDSFLIIISFDIFGSFGVADFAFLICFYLFLVEHPFEIDVLAL